jgi:DNA-binding MarR family transcriptional regulator
MNEKQDDISPKNTGKGIYQTGDYPPISLELRKTFGLIKTYLGSHATESLHAGLSVAEGTMLGFIFQHPSDVITAKEVIQRAGTGKATVSQTLNSLEKKGFIQMIPSVKDKRVKEIRLTERGIALNQRFIVVFNEVNGVIENGLTDEEKAELIRLLEKIRRNLSATDSTDFS